MVLQRTLNIHGTFQTQERLFIVKKDFENVLQNGYFRNCSLPWGTKNGSSMASLQKHPFETFNFKSVVEKWFFYHVAKLFLGGFTAMPQKNHFCFPKEPFSEQFLKEPFFFLSMKNISTI